MRYFSIGTTFVGVLFVLFLLLGTKEANAVVMQDNVTGQYKVVPALPNFTDRTRKGYKAACVRANRLDNINKGRCVIQKNSVSGDPIANMTDFQCCMAAQRVSGTGVFRPNRQ